MKAKRFLSLLLALLMLAAFALPAFAAKGSAEAPALQATLLFTHDMHSHMLPATDQNGSYGGFARLKTAIDREKELYPDAVLADAGDFAMGSLFQAAFSTDALELRGMGQLGFEVTTFGNHEFDYRGQGCADMLNAAAASGEPLPQLVCANYRPPMLGEAGYSKQSEAMWTAMDNYGVKDYTVINRGGVNFAFFGIMGVDAHACSPMGGMVLEDPVATAQEVVDRIEREVPEPCLVVCLSHSGTNPDKSKSEDHILAEKTRGIDIIVSGHTHTVLPEAVKVKDTYLVGAGAYCHYLGSVSVNNTGEGWSLAEYKLLAIDDSLPEDPAVAAKMEEYKGLVEESYLSRFGGLTYDQVMVKNPYDFPSLDHMYDVHEESALGNLITDAYMAAVRKAEGENYVPVDFALTAVGVVRETLPKGDVTVSDVFNISSLGIGADGVPGYPLVCAYVTGKDLRNVFEVDASVQPIMREAQLYLSGMEYTFNPHRMIFNKVTDCAQVLPDGTRLAIEDDKLYRVVTGLYCGQMLGAVNDKSFGILSITPRDEKGEPITDLEQHILHNPDGTEVKEWYALADYLREMGTVSQEYSAPQGRKTVDRSRNPVKLLAGANALTIAVLIIGLVLLVLIILLVRCIVVRVKHPERLRRRKKQLPDDEDIPGSEK